MVGLLIINSTTHHVSGKDFSGLENIMMLMMSSRKPVLSSEILSLKDVDTISWKYPVMFFLRPDLQSQ